MWPDDELELEGDDDAGELGDIPDPSTWTPEQWERLRRVATGEADRDN